MKVIGFCGLPGSGKSTAIEAISELGSVITMGDVIRNEAKKMNIEPTSENLGKIAKSLREQGGQEIVAKKCIDFIKVQENDIVFIDGLRSMAEVNVFRQAWKFPIIATEIDEDIRLKRLIERARSDDPKTIDDLKTRDDREIGFGLRDVIENADYKIKNETSREKLEKRVREIVLKILKDY